MRNSNFHLYFLLVLLFSFCCGSAISPFTDYPSSNGVILANKEIYRELLRKYDYVFITFSASWCSHCQTFEKLLPEISTKIHEQIHKLIPVAKMDCEKRYEFCHETLNIGGYPTVRLYHKGVPVEYKGERATENVLRWLDDRHNHALEDFKGNNN